MLIMYIEKEKRIKTPIVRLAISCTIKYLTALYDSLPPLIRVRNISVNKIKILHHNIKLLDSMVIKETKKTSKNNILIIGHIAPINWVIIFIFILFLLLTFKLYFFRLWKGTNALISGIKPSKRFTYRSKRVKF